MWQGRLGPPWDWGAGHLGVGPGCLAIHLSLGSQISSRGQAATGWSWAWCRPPGPLRSPPLEERRGVRRWGSGACGGSEAKCC